MSSPRGSMELENGEFVFITHRKFDTRLNLEILLSQTTVSDVDCKLLTACFCYAGLGTGCTKFVLQIFERKNFRLKKSTFIF